MAKDIRVKAYISIAMKQKLFPPNNQQLNNKYNIHFQDL
jgi:hypothetical protein